MHIQHSSHSSEVPCVVYLDDEVGNRQAFEAAFRKEFKVICVDGLGALWTALQEHQVHVLITDQRMPGMTGSEVLALVRERYPSVKRMLVTAYADLQAIVDALNRGGVCYYIQKPWEVDQVRKAVLNAFAETKAESERAAFTRKLITSNEQLEFALRQRLLS